MTSLSRRRVLAVGGASLFTGCSQLPVELGSDNKLQFAADPIGIREETVSATAFEVASDESFTTDRFSNVGDISQPIEVSAHMLHLEGTKAPIASQMVAVAFPTIEVAENQIDVAQQVDHLSLIPQANDSVADIQRGEKLRERDVRIIGKERTVGVFQGSQSQSGESARVLICRSSFTHANDVIFTLGMVSRMAYDDEQVLLDLFRGLVRE